MADSPEKSKPAPITHTSHGKITQISYGMTVNVGNYEVVRFDLTAQVPEGEDWRDVLESLRRKSRNLKQNIQKEGD